MTAGLIVSFVPEAEVRVRPLGHMDSRLQENEYPGSQPTSAARRDQAIRRQRGKEASASKSNGVRRRRQDRDGEPSKPVMSRPKPTLASRPRQPQTKPRPRQCPANTSPSVPTGGGTSLCTGVRCPTTIG